MRFLIARHKARELTIGLLQYEEPKDRIRLSIFFRDDLDSEVDPYGLHDAVLHRGGYSFHLRPGDYVRPGELVVGYEGDSTYVYQQDIIETHFTLEEMPAHIGLLSSFIDYAQEAGEEWLYYTGVENGPDPAAPRQADPPHRGRGA